MRNTLVVAVCGIAVCHLISTLPVRAEETLMLATRKIFDQHKDSVVWVSAVAKMSFGSGDGKPLPMNIPDREQKFEANGTVLDASGLTVAALSTLDPTKEVNGREINTPDGRITLEASAILKEVRIILADGTEVPADLVMKDADLDLAFIRPRADAKETQQSKFKPLDLKNNATGSVADEAVTVSRADEVLNRQSVAQRGQITCVTQKPRTFLRVTGANPGCPTFSTDDKVLGICVNRSMRERPQVTVVLPAGDVLEIAEQAKTAKPVSTEAPASKPEKPAPKEEGGKK